MSTGQKEDLDALIDDEIHDLADNLERGVPMATPVFDGAKEEEIKAHAGVSGSCQNHGQTYFI